MPSTVIDTFHYEKETKSLIVVFVSGAVYSYKNVPEKVYQQMKNAFSKGVFLNTKIKDNYDFEKLNE
jgi:hypothetical protein